MTAMLFDFPSQPEQFAKSAKKSKPKPKPKPKPNGYTEEFETKVWVPYPRKLNCSKLMAFKAWERLPEESQAQLIAAMPVFVLSCRGKDEAYIPHLATWINQRRFETVVVPRSTVPPAPTAVDWPAMVRIFKATGRWNQEFGPAPDEAGYRGPDV